MTTCLESGINELRKYNTLNLVIAPHLTHLPEREKGFIDFCKQNSFNYQTEESIKDINPGNAYILQSDEDLSELIKICKAKKIKIGKDVGIISYNHSPLMEFVEGGISVLSSDFKKMGKTAVKLITENKKEKVENDFELILRNSVWYKKPEAKI